MNAHKTYLYYLLILFSSAVICACARSAPPVESFQAGETITQTDRQTETDSSKNTVPNVSETSLKAEQKRFDDFTMDIFRTELSESPLSLHCTVSQPENYGIRVSEMTLGDFSVETLKESSAEVKQMKEKLSGFNAALLTTDQLFTYKMLSDYLDTEMLSDGLELYSQPLSPTIGTQAQLPILFAEYAFNEKSDVDNYLALLSTIDSYYKQLADFEKVQADAGLAMSDATLDRIIQSCKNYMIRPENSFLTETFDSKIKELPDLTEDEKSAYRAQHLTILKEHFIPAYENLTAELTALKGRGTNENGICNFKDGKRYYEYLAASDTGTDSSITELRRRIEKQVGSDMAELSLLSQNNPQLASEVGSYSFSLSEPTEILENLRSESLKDFPALENSSFTVKNVPKALESSLSPAFFLIPPIDDYVNGTIYINGLSEQTDGSLYTTLAHEGYPGHLYQTLYVSQKNSCPLRRLLSCGGYSEGWGTYAELYSYAFDNGLSDVLKKALPYNQSSILALYALLDIRINYEGWDLTKTADFLNTYYGITQPDVTEEIFQSVIDNPANYLKYYTGYLEIITLRDTAESTLGNRYTPMTFHKFMLDMDGASFRVIKPYFQTWLLTFDVNQ